MTTLIVLIVIGVIIGIAVSIYNGLIRLRNTSEQAWSDIDVQLKRRYDLIPNLVETVKGYATHEQETFEKVVQARSAAMDCDQTRTSNSPRRPTSIPDTMIVLGRPNLSTIMPPTEPF